MVGTDFELDICLEDHLYLGAVVVAVDGSWVMEKTKGSDLQEVAICSPCYEGKDHLYQIVGVNKPYLTPEKRVTKSIASPINNIKMRDLTTGKIFYCSNLNIRNITWGNLFDKGVASCKYNGEYRDIKDLFKEVKFYDKSLEKKY